MTLRALREDKGLTQAQLAKLAKLDQTTISALELGKVVRPANDTVKALALALDCSRETIEDAIHEAVLEAA